MLSYIVAFVAALLFLANPISQFFYPQTPRIRHSPRPQLNESLLALDGPNDTAPVCPPDTYAARILSSEPLVVYLEGFLLEEERKHLLEIRYALHRPAHPATQFHATYHHSLSNKLTSEPLFEPSTITHDANSTHLNTTVRDSHVALIPRTDSVRCIEARARAVQGWRRDVWLERLRTQRYVPGGHYSHHFDWSGNSGGWGRVSSFMVWVDDGDGELEGGGTEFPLLRMRTDKDGKACGFVECGENEDAEDKETGVVFKALPGNAVYWENFAPNGQGYDETWHAGLPVTKGVKVGLNIWSFGRIE